MRDTFGVELVDSIEKAIDGCDAILLESVDGRVHLGQFNECLKPGQPVFIDKPFTVTTHDADEILRLAGEHGVPVMSASALRYAEAVQAEAGRNDLGGVIGADCQGPMALLPEMPGYFWYGIHGVEMVYALMGPGCESVTAFATENDDIAVGRWNDGRFATVRGKRGDNKGFNGIVTHATGTSFIDVAATQTKPFYYFLLEKVLEFFRTGQSPISNEEMREVVRFMEAANESRAGAGEVKL